MSTDPARVARPRTRLLPVAPVPPPAPAGPPRVLYVDAGGRGIAAVAPDGRARVAPPQGVTHSTVAELHAIALAVSWLEEDPPESAVILCDNVGAVKSANGVGNVGPAGAQSLANSIRARMRDGWLVAWVPRQKNRAADRAARTWRP